MKIIMRWTPEMPISLQDIRQIPYVSGVASEIAVPVGAPWSFETISELKNTIEKAGLSFEVVESVKVHEDIKLGLPARDVYIQNYKITIRNLAKAGIKVICYDFMPVFDWMRTDTNQRMADGSSTLAYNAKTMETANPLDNTFALEDWEAFYTPLQLKELFKCYQVVNEEQLWENLAYFLREIIPVAEECDVKMGMHPDDPPWSIWGLPRIITCEKNIDRLLSLYDSPCNGLTLCSGSLGASAFNNVETLVQKYAGQGKIYFGHMRNVKRFPDGSFEETAHFSESGSLDMATILRAYHDTDFTGYIRPDHGRMIWGERGMAGYGLYDRALGAAYLSGIWESLQKQKTQGGNRI